MELRFFGHAMFGVSSGGKTVVIDPFNDDVGYPRPTVAADAVVITHEHSDHSNVDLVGGTPRVIRCLSHEGKAWARIDEQVGPIHITGVGCYHDTNQGTARGLNTIIIVEAEGLRLVHLGDLGHLLSDEQARAIGRVDVLMIPVGGHYTIGPVEADAVVAQVKPRVVIPMHFKTQFNASWPIGTLDEYLAGKTGVKSIGPSATLTPGALPTALEYWVLA